MNLTKAQARKLLRLLRNKFGIKECSIEIIFNSWTDEHFRVYVEDSDIKVFTKFTSLEEAVETYEL